MSSPARPRATTSAGSPRCANASRCRRAPLPSRRIASASAVTSSRSPAWSRAPSHPGQQLPHHVRGRERRGRARRHEVLREAVAGRPPQGRAEQRGRGGPDRHPGLGVGHTGPDQRPGQAGQAHGRVDVQADVGRPELEGRIAIGRSQVPVQVRGVLDGVGLPELVHHLVVRRPISQGGGQAGRRPPFPDLEAVGVVAGVLTVPVRRVGGEGQQDRDPRPDPRHHLDDAVGILDPHVDVAPTDHLLTGDPLVPVLHLPEAGPVVLHLLVLPRAPGMGGQRQDPAPDRFGDAVQLRAEPDQFGPDLAEVGTDRCRRLDLTPVQLCGHAVAERASSRRDELVGPGDQLAGRPIDDLELLLHPEGGAVHPACPFVERPSGRAVTRWAGPRAPGARR